MNKPIYRYLSDQKWRSMKRKILMQRITQMNVIPDVLANIDPVLEVTLSWHKRNVVPGEIAPAKWSEGAPNLKIQKFDKGEAKLTVIAVDSDVPNTETDSFEYKCHGVWTDISVTPTTPDIGRLGAEGMNTVIPWSPPFAQKGSPYHRISLFVFVQPDGKTLSPEQIETLKQNIETSSDFWLRGFCELTGFKPRGVTMFRTVWDESTPGVLARNGLEGADVELRKKKPERLPQKYLVKDGLRYRGWKK